MTSHILEPPRRRTMPMWIAAVIAPLVAVSLVAVASAPANATATPVPLGTADSFAVLAGTTVTNTGPSVITGDLGVSPGTAITGFPPGLVNGVQHSADAVALQAKSDLVAAYNDAAGQATNGALPPDAGGLTLVPGVYTASSTLGLTGTLTLDAQGDPNAVWVFQVGSGLTTASASQVLLVNGASPCNVYWQVGSSATIGTNSTFVGTILALTSISVTTGSSIDGRALARNGAVTLDTNRITRPSCATGGTTGGLITGGLVAGTTTGGLVAGTTTGGTTTGATTTGTTGGTSGGLLGGVTTGGTGGLLGGVLGGVTTGGLVAGTTGGTTGATTVGATAGTTGSTTVGTTAGATAGSTGGYGHHPGKPGHGKPGHGKHCKPKKHPKPAPAKHKKKHCKPKSKKKHHAKPAGYGDNQGYGAKPNLQAV